MPAKMHQVPKATGMAKGTAFRRRALGLSAPHSCYHWNVCLLFVICYRLAKGRPPTPQMLEPWRI